MLRKFFVEIMDTLLAIFSLLAVGLGWYVGGAIGLVGAIVACAICGSLWSALSLCYEELSEIRKLKREELLVLKGMNSRLDVLVTNSNYQTAKVREISPKVDTSLTLHEIK